MTDPVSEKAIWLDHFTSQITSHEQLSKDYAYLAVQSLIGINAGALLAIPPIVQVFFSTTLHFGDAVWTMLLFLVGLLCAVACSYAAYFNFQFNAQYTWIELHKQMGVIDEKHDVSTVHRLRSWRATTRKDLEQQAAKYERLINVCYYVSNGFGVASLLAFVAGVFVFAFVAMGRA